MVLLRRRNRRILGGVLIVLGALLMWLAPGSPGGWVAFGLALALELLGWSLERRA